MVCLGLTSDRDANGNNVGLLGYYTLPNCLSKCGTTTGCNYVAWAYNNNKCYGYKTINPDNCGYHSYWRHYKNDGLEKLKLESNYDITVKRDVAVGHGPYPLCYKCVSSKANPSYHTGAA
jgi:hypothetical protein